MSAVRSKNTQPEMLVRRLVHAMGFRYRLHVRSLPGTPDIVLARHHRIIEVRGCFWHRHLNCTLTTTPATRPKFWADKFRGTQERDKKNLSALRKEGWHVLVVWECETRNHERMRKRITRFLTFK